MIFSACSVTSVSLASVISQLVSITSSTFGSYCSVAANFAFENPSACVPECVFSPGLKHAKMGIAPDAIETVLSRGKCSLMVMEITALRRR